MNPSRTARAIATALVLFTGIAIIAVAAARIMRPRPDHVDPDRSRYPIRGIDISAHNGIIDFTRVAADSITFVYIKASEGDTFRDAAFTDNHARALAAGLHVGAYHYFRFDCEGWRQAANLLRAVGNLPLDLPLAIDLEEWRNHPATPTGEVIVRLHGMVDYLRGAGRRVIIYTNKSGHHRFIRAHFDDLPLWICSFTDPPLPQADWTLWQHSHKGHISGIPGPVDLNTFCGDTLAFRRWLHPTP